MTDTTIHTWDLFSDYIFNFIKTKVKTEDDAKDVLQEVFLKVHLNIEKLKDTEKLQSWIFNITRNTINDYWKKQKSTVQVEEIPELDNNNNEDYTSYFEVCLKSMISDLPEKYREAIQLSEIDNKKQKEISDTLNISYSGLKSRVQRGRELLKNSFKECCNIQINKSGQVISGDIEMEHCTKCKAT